MRIGVVKELRAAAEDFQPLVVAGAAESARELVEALSAGGDRGGLGRVLSYSGLAMVEFRRGPDGVGYLMEVNGRVWGSLPLAVRAGMDFPALLVDDVDHHGGRRTGDPRPTRRAARPRPSLP